MCKECGKSEQGDSIEMSVQRVCERYLAGWRFEEERCDEEDTQFV